MSFFHTEIIDMVYLTPYLPYSLSPSNHLASHESTRLMEMKKRLTDRLISAGNNIREPNSTEDVWTYADVLIGIAPADVNKIAKDTHIEFFLSHMKPNDNCWVQGKRKPDENDPCHLAATGWVLLALGKLGAEAPDKTWSLILQEQHRKGWWALYQSAKHSNENSSTYSTAIITLAMKQHLGKSLIPPSKIKIIQTRFEYARTWLSTIRMHKGCNWPDYPYNEKKKTDIKALSGMILYVLDQLDYQGMQEICRECLSALISEYIPIDSTDTNSVIEFFLNDGSIVADTVDHLNLIWSGMGVLACYPKANLFERMRSRAFISKSLFSETATPEQKLKATWQAAEASLFVRAMIDEEIF